MKGIWGSGSRVEIGKLSSEEGNLKLRWGFVQHSKAEREKLQSRAVAEQSVSVNGASGGRLGWGSI